MKNSQIGTYRPSKRFFASEVANNANMGILKEGYPRYLSNRAKCLLCGEIIESTYRHDFRWCSCRNLAVDGGLDYLKRSFIKPDSWIDMSKTAEVESEGSKGATRNKKRGNK